MAGTVENKFGLSRKTNVAIAGIAGTSVVKDVKSTVILVLVLVLVLVSLGYSQPIQPRAVRRTGGGASYLVAASNAPATVKSRADYICDGTDDDVQIQAAHDALTAGIGGVVHLSSGQFNISSPLQFNRMLTLEGEGAQQTIIYLADDSDCNMIELADPNSLSESVVLPAFRHFRLNGNRDNNAGTLYGIIQQACPNDSYGWVDIQFEDLWIDRINGDGISLQQRWDHRIERCVFEHIDDAAIQLNVPTDTDLAAVWISDCFGLDIGQFIEKGTADTDEEIDGLVIQGCHVTASTTAADGHFLGLPPVKHARIVGNYFAGTFQTDNTYSMIDIDYTTTAKNLLNAEVIIADNMLTDAAGSNGSKYGISVQTYTASAKTLRPFKINNNIIVSGDTYGILLSPTNFRYTYTVSVTNNTFLNAGDGLYLNTSGGLVSGNHFGNSGTYSIYVRYGYDVSIIGNSMTKPIALSTSPGDTIIANNKGDGMRETLDNETANLATFGHSLLDAANGAVTGTLKDLEGSLTENRSAGQTKTITMTDATNSSTVTVTNHRLGVSEVVGTFDAIGESWTLVWTGEVWDTMSASCTLSRGNVVSYENDNVFYENEIVIY